MILFFAFVREILFIIFILAYTKGIIPSTPFFIKHIIMKKNNESTVFVVGLAQVAFFLFIMLLIGAIAG